ncbi:MBL fold metallo-hydrolase [Arthrobacter sp. EH-1B-1]|uniref:MBL fold metallo-hydrolase n=1 Tax=Arthrobacter vasquezii TaxID=2977629 RepID=A0ABT6D0X0_9MICC|nr:MBL fold metallo-hydrolase [Arthrobacter vasquezii]MDF9279586.1 MBL fold metallo-hydrolase [Arthrobacter vasquezii]
MFSDDGGPTSSTLTSSGPLSRYRLAPNPGPMSLDGTNSYVLSAPDSRGVVVVDPGPLDEAHLAALHSCGPVELVLITHHHRDHTEASARFHELTAAPVRAFDSAHCHGGNSLADGEVLSAAGVRINVLATPGHTADSGCFHLPDDGPNGSVLTGDTILGRGTTVLSYPDGTLGDYLRSLDVLESLGAPAVLPAHGPTLPNLGEVIRAYRMHRLERLDQVRAALLTLGLSVESADVGSVTDRVYAEVDPSVRRAAEQSVAAQLHYLREERSS